MVKLAILGSVLTLLALPVAGQTAASKPVPKQIDVEALRKLMAPIEIPLCGTFSDMVMVKDQSGEWKIKKASPQPTWELWDVLEPNGMTVVVVAPKERK